MSRGMGQIKDISELSIMVFIFEAAKFWGSPIPVCSQHPRHYNFEIWLLQNGVVNGSKQNKNNDTFISPFYFTQLPDISRDWILVSGALFIRIHPSVTSFSPPGCADNERIFPHCPWWPSGDPIKSACTHLYNSVVSFLGRHSAHHLWITASSSSRDKLQEKSGQRENCDELIKSLCCNFWNNSFDHGHI